jgi:hypothetical protein
MNIIRLKDLQYKKWYSKMPRTHQPENDKYSGALPGTVPSQLLLKQLGLEIIKCATTGWRVCVIGHPQPPSLLYGKGTAAVESTGAVFIRSSKGCQGGDDGRGYRNLYKTPRGPNLEPRGLMCVTAVAEAGLGGPNLTWVVIASHC